MEMFRSMKKRGLYTYNGLNENLYGKDNVNWADEGYL